MSRRKIPNRQALIQALTENSGNLAATGRRFNCSRHYIWQLVHGDLELLKLVEELSESFKDEAENLLYDHIRSGNVVACIFYLKTKARDRGYSERFEITAIAQQSIEVDLGSEPTHIEAKDNPADAIDANAAPIALLEQ